jgi:hypothetical protein
MKLLTRLPPLPIYIKISVGVFLLLLFPSLLPGSFFSLLSGLPGWIDHINGIDSTNIFLIDWTWHIDLIPQADGPQK